MSISQSQLRADFGADLVQAPVVELRGLGKTFGNISVLRNVDMDIRAGEVHALMGENGAGKSTLVKILSGVISQHVGTIRIAGQEQHFFSPVDAEAAGIAIMHQELSLVPEMSVAENVTLGREPLWGNIFVDRKTAANNTNQLLAKFGFSLSPDTPVSSLRVGEQQLVEIVRALSLDAKLLIMDEPTSALSQAETEVLMEVIRDLALHGVAILYISHRMDEVFDIADRITVLRDGDLIGSRTSDEFDRGSIVEMMVGRRIDEVKARRKGSPSKDIALAVEHLTVESEMRSQQKTHRKLLDDVSLKVHKGEILGITGLLGAGRTELLESLFGARARVVAGDISIEGTLVEIDSPKTAVELGLALITEDRKNTGLLVHSTVRDNIALPSLAKMSQGGVPWVASREKVDRVTQTAISELNIKCNGANHIVSALSGGNQQKVVLGKWLATSPKILLLDEPTRGIDIGAKDEIYQLICGLADQGIAIIMASSEIPELISICDRMVVLCEGRKVGEIEQADFSADLIKEMSMQFG